MNKNNFFKKKINLKDLLANRSWIVGKNIKDYGGDWEIL